MSATSFRRTAWTAVAALGLVATSAPAQERPNLSGTWSVAAGGPRARQGAPAGDPGSGWGPRFTIAQSGDRLTVVRPFFARGDLQPEPTFHYALDGSESVNTLLMGRGIQEMRSTARWEGGRLVIVTEHTAPGALDGRTVTSEVRHTLWLEPSRRLTGAPTLVIETTRIGIMGGSTSTTRTVHTRG